MGAVALVALLAGGPLGMCLAIAYGVVSLTKIAKVDSEYAKNGQAPPSARLIEKWLDSRAAKGAKPEKVKPYGSWAYAKQRWSAMWEDLGEKHAEQRTADKKARAEAKAKGLPLPAKRTMKDRVQSLKSWKWYISGVPATAGNPTGPNEVQIWSCRACGKSLTAPVAQVLPAAEFLCSSCRPSVADSEGRSAEPAAKTPRPDGPRIACEDCGQTLRPTDDGWVHPSSAGCPKRAPQMSDAEFLHRHGQTRSTDPLPENSSPSYVPPIPLPNAVEREQVRRAALTPEETAREQAWRERVNAEQQRASQARLEAMQAVAHPLIQEALDKYNRGDWAGCVTGLDDAERRFPLVYDTAWSESTHPDKDSAVFRLETVHAEARRRADLAAQGLPTPIPGMPATDNPDVSTEPSHRRSGPAPQDRDRKEAQRHRPSVQAAHDPASPDQPAPTGEGNTATEGNTMTQTTTAPQQSGEVVGLMSAITYAETVAAAHAAHSTGGGEGYRASLGQANVGPETVKSAAEAQELSEMAGAAWAQHAAKLREQLAAKEATTAETGSKEFLLSE